MKKDFRYREIPYNYTSFSDKEIIIKYLGQDVWDSLNELRLTRKTGQSAKLLFEIIGDIFIIERNPYVFNDYYKNSYKQAGLKRAHKAKLHAIEDLSEQNLQVLNVIDKVNKLEDEFFNNFKVEKNLRNRIFHKLKNYTSKDNIKFSAFHKVSHSTDATDWRVEYPTAVVFPDKEKEVANIVKAAKDLGLKVIPRGGGTGLTGGAIPFCKNTLIINTEKLVNIGEVEYLTPEQPIVEVEAGVVINDVVDKMKKHGLVFAADPTSAWAATIGGCISENAGGKKAVMWGTTIDNIYSFKMVTPSAEVIEVVRRNHPYHKILPNEDVIFDVYRLDKKECVFLNSLKLQGKEIRKKDLWKDITNKTLHGIPGLQKEGCDGVIISAKFVLYPKFKFQKTLCLEFFGSNMVNASQAIVDILSKFEKDNQVFLTALEHFDDKYVEAINYRLKSSRTENPKAVLLIDINSNQDELLNQRCCEVVELVQKYNTEGFIAESAAEQEKFWNDRKQLGAISKHTNAFKLNEDIVIPIVQIPAFADFIDKLNLQKSLENYCLIAESFLKYFKELRGTDVEQFLPEKIDFYCERLNKQISEYKSFSGNLDKTAAEMQISDVEPSKSLFKLLQDGDLVLDFQKDIILPFEKRFKNYSNIIEDLNEILKRESGRKIIIATHMHAGDGNVHVNIPVHSSDYLMMVEANDTAAAVMKKTVALGGVVSGEHGIGLTKIKFIEQDVLDEFTTYRHSVDPQNMFNPHKLDRSFDTNLAYTPSFNLLELEAFILKVADLEKLSQSISCCVRCGKCKSVCNTHYPAGGMFYNSRNKILAIALIIEAVLFDTQRFNKFSFRHFDKLNEIANYCTVCHKCKKPCPVDIDFGKITVQIRELLADRKQANKKPVTKFTLLYLKQRNYFLNKVMRNLVLNCGYKAQRLGFTVLKPFRFINRKIVPFIAAFLESKFPKGVGEAGFRDYLKLNDKNYFYAIVNPKMPIKKSVIYFPGCGSERMFPEISMATLALLYNQGIRVVVPPEFLCCGYPFLANGKREEAEMRSSENRVIFHRMADTIGYMDIKDVVVSCGTCYDMLSTYDLGNVFEGAKIIDINDFLVKESLYTVDKLSQPLSKVFYHVPCHSPLKVYGDEKTVEKLLGQKPEITKYCCGEAGTMSLSTPLISNNLREHKKEGIKAVATEKKVNVLTTCPMCTQGLTKASDQQKVIGKSLVVEVADVYLGKNWKKQIKHFSKHGKIEKILF